uniref:Uncharacterized protein n=1 Tax=Globisporangium ultimum (strain ATCC 200006 / CBS 805.95 / DAOM BR144) TaxID=431595 RepID=K3X4E5_GLOUD
MYIHVSILGLLLIKRLISVWACSIVWEVSIRRKSWLVVCCS